MKFCWCDLCAAWWGVVFGLVGCWWMQFGSGYLIPFLLVTFVVLTVVILREREDLYFWVQGLVNEIWWWAVTRRTYRRFEVRPPRPELRPCR